MERFKEFDSARPFPCDSIPLLSPEDFRFSLKECFERGYLLSVFFAMPGFYADGGNGARGRRLCALLRRKGSAMMRVAAFFVPETPTGFSYSSLSVHFSCFHAFEREIAEQESILPKGHPYLKPLRFERRRSGNAAAGDPWKRSTEEDWIPHLIDVSRVEGESIHEVAVGPVHAGVIEPGHFRFQCWGELVYRLEIQLGYQHRGIEKRLSDGSAPNGKTIHYMETLAGDSSIAHALAYCELMEKFLGPVPPRASLIRVLALELERVANHVGDLGALAGDVAFLPTSSFCGRIRGEYLNMSAALCGNRFGRNLLIPGGVRCGVTQEIAERILAWIDRVWPETLQALKLLFNTPTVLDRFEGVGVLAPGTAKELGATGIVGKASGQDFDLRRDYPSPSSALYSSSTLFRVPTEENGDVLARAKLRFHELKVSIAMIRSFLKDLPFDGPLLSGDGVFHSAAPDLPGGMLALSFTEGWRGEICHLALTDANGKFCRYKVIDPSFRNWQALALALRDQQISDFPICNKSFNLSYCGHDL